ncbi:hypothetical protein F0562_026869 [Nyssa sinensis]|uniref:Plastocyanin-like domain-containing protein n=1 Tax=Nyssa sinensis TaxID=561372 RepID=A0A5J5B4F2_9ASTE|nr:hypothetical protein F0562_026869 [Nyssa sinensis]
MASSASSSSSGSAQSSRKPLGFLTNAMKRKDNFIQFFVMTGILLLSVRSLGQKYRTNDLLEDTSALKQEQEGLTDRMKHIKRSLKAEAALDPTGHFACRLHLLFADLEWGDNEEDTILNGVNEEDSEGESDTREVGTDSSNNVNEGSLSSSSEERREERIRRRPIWMDDYESAFFGVAVALLAIVRAEDPYRFFNWNVTYGDIYPLGVRQQGILINGQFPGPDIYSVTNDNLIINVFNSLTEPFLLSWNGIQQRRNSFEDGVYGTTCPIPPGKNFTYILQVKDQIGSFYYFPSLAFHKAAGGFGGIRILSRPRIPVPFADPSGDYTVLIGDWYQSNHTTLQAILDRGKKLPFPDGKTYRLRISNVGLQNSLNFRIQNHKMTLVEVEGTHTLQTTYSSLDVHVGQSYSVLITADQPGQDYYIVVSSRFTTPVLTTTGVLHYSNSAGPVSGPPPGGPTIQIDWSLNQARSVRTNLTASGPRPNPQGSYHYGLINTTKTIRLANSAGQVNGKQRYAVNSVSFVPADTPLKLADYFSIGGVYRVGSISDNPTGGGIYLDTAVLNTDYRAVH